jgi:REP element-mobilizing transposase RayT
MARRVRIQYPGATYHIINRGNYRRDVFEGSGAITAFEAALGEACRCFGWGLHAYVVMRNHFHLALTTTTPNLVDGMHWLLTTFAVRFNRFRSENGHLFQGRYQALLIEDEGALSRVVDYIHLNPVRARRVTAQEVADFPHGSLLALRKDPRPDFLVPAPWLSALDLEDTPAGWSRYIARLQSGGADVGTEDRTASSEFSRGWAIGTDTWRQAMARENSHWAAEPGMAAEEMQDLREARWKRVLEAELAADGRTLAEAPRCPKGVAWKVRIARCLRESAGAPHAWIARTLHMGSVGSVRVAVSRLRKQPDSGA